MQFMLDNGNDHDWFASPMILTLGLIAVVSLSFLIAWELNAKHPVIDLSLFKQRNFTVGVSGDVVRHAGVFRGQRGVAAVAADDAGLYRHLVRPDRRLGRRAGIPVSPGRQHAGQVRSARDDHDGFRDTRGCSFWLSTFDSSASYGSMIWPDW
jgi:DHA2 family multidrug resistance protein